MKPIHLLLLAAMLSLATANAATLAVLEIIIANDEIDFTIDETKFLTDELRRQAAWFLPNDYSVLTREKIISLVPPTAENLTSVIDIGKAIKSDYVTNGFIGKLGSLFTLTVELYETQSGNLLGDFVKESTDMKGLLDAVRENAPRLFVKIMPKEEPKQEKAKDTQSVAAVAIPTNIPAEPKKSKNSLWAAIGLDVFGATALGLGIYNNAKSIKYHSESQKLIKDMPKDREGYELRKSEFNSKLQKMQIAETVRNIFYATGGALLLGGIGIYIWF